MGLTNTSNCIVTLIILTDEIGKRAMLFRVAVRGRQILLQLGVKRVSAPLCVG
ncbi:MAG: hypothetical protein JWN43_3713 [Gammaproteobacteria bacterium]|nr:hypothetical protein [Gammaproteobacteria bacterium]